MAASAPVDVPALASAKQNAAINFQDMASKEKGDEMSSANDHGASQRQHNSSLCNATNEVRTCRDADDGNKDVETQ